MYESLQQSRRVCRRFLTYKDNFKVEKMHTFERLFEMKASGIIQRRVLFPYCQPVNRIVELSLDAKRRELFSTYKGCH